MLDIDIDIGRNIDIDRDVGQMKTRVRSDQGFPAIEHFTSNWSRSRGVVNS